MLDLRAADGLGDRDHLLRGLFLIGDGLGGLLLLGKSELLFSSLIFLAACRAWAAMLALRDSSASSVGVFDPLKKASIESKTCFSPRAIRT